MRSWKTSDRKKNTSQRPLQPFYRDSVTGGYSVGEFEQKAVNLITAAPAGAYVFLSLDIVKFKLINDAFGSEAGDKVLRYIYRVLEKNISKGELLCRQFADNFNLLLKNASQEEITERIRRISSDINSFNEYTVNKYYLSVSAGVYCIDDTALSVVYIRDRANVARKKREDGTENHLFSCFFYSDRARQLLQMEKNMENRMGEALKNGEFTVYLQPKIEVKSRRFSGAEALVRWNDKEKGLIMPDDFIPFFEKNGFIVQLDLFVFEQVCRMIRDWIDAGKTPLPISVNLSRIHMSRPGFLRDYRSIQERYHIAPKLLEIELTENLFFENLDLFLQVIAEIRGAGFLCSLDDFGSGYSSLNMLKDIQVDILKLDKAFFGSAQSDNPREKAIIESVVAMAKKLDMVTISEGVESLQQLEFLEDIGCDMAQGYLISKPVPLEEFEQMVFDRDGSLTL